MTTYVFADHPAGPVAHHGDLTDMLAQVLDPFTIARLRPLIDAAARSGTGSIAGQAAGSADGHAPAPGSASASGSAPAPGSTTGSGSAPAPGGVVRCLELGAGAGSIAHWMADLGGEVTATDLDISRIPPHPRLTVRVHDLAAEELPGSGWDLIHARLLLAHLPGRRQILMEKLVPALASGGWLVIEEFDPGWDRCGLTSPGTFADNLAGTSPGTFADTFPGPDTPRLFAAYHQALQRVLTTAGSDPGWGRGLHQMFTDAGLVDVDTEFHARGWRGGEPGCELPRLLADQVRPQLIAAGMSAPDIDAFRGVLADSRLVIRGNLAVSTRGRMP